MAFMAPVMGMIGSAVGSAGIGTVLSLGGSVISAISGINAAKAEQKQLNINAGQEEAASQRRALLARDKANLMISRAMAVGAASGAGTSGIEGILTDIAGRGEEAAQGDLYQGKEKANSLRYQGKVGVSQAKSQAMGTLIGAAGKAMPGGGGTVGSLFDRFSPSAAPTMDYGYSEGTGFGGSSKIW